MLVGADKLVVDSCRAAPPPSDLRLPPNENAGELATFGATAVSLLMAPPLIENAVVPDSPPADLTEASPNENVEALADTAASEAAGGLGLVTPNDDANAGGALYNIYTSGVDGDGAAGVQSGSGSSTVADDCVVEKDASTSSSAAAASGAKAIADANKQQREVALSHTCARAHSLALARALSL